MKIILIRPSNIINCWETEDACIIEMANNKKWVCEKFFVSDVDMQKWNTMLFIKQHQDNRFIELLLKGKSE